MAKKGPQDLLHVVAGRKDDAMMELLNEEKLDLKKRCPRIMRGKFFYSLKQFIWQRRDNQRFNKHTTAVRPKMYCELDDGRIVEYTEMVPIEALAVNLQEKALCEDMFDDVKVLGFGWFHHHGEDVA